mgnify:CR=1 FL=1
MRAGRRVELWAGYWVRRLGPKTAQRRVGRMAGQLAGKSAETKGWRWVEMWVEM